MLEKGYSPEDVAMRGRLRWRELNPTLEPGNRGKYLVINVETGDYEMADDALQASRKARAKYPGEVLYGMRIGYPASGRLDAAWRGAS